MFLFHAALDLIEHLRAMGETNALLQRTNVRHLLDNDVQNKKSRWCSNKGSAKLTLTLAIFCYSILKPDPEEGNSSSNRSHLWFNVCSRRWHHPCNFPGQCINIHSKSCNLEEENMHIINLLFSNLAIWNLWSNFALTSLWLFPIFYFYIIVCKLTESGRANSAI